MSRGAPFDLPTLMLTAVALGFALVAYWKDPGLPWIGAKTGLSLIWFILPRLVPALILTGMLQVVIPQEAVARYFGHGSGLTAILMASVAGVLTPGGPMVSVPLLVVLANSGMAPRPPGPDHAAVVPLRLPRLNPVGGAVNGVRLVAVRGGI